MSSSTLQRRCAPDFWGAAARPSAAERDQSLRRHETQHEDRGPAGRQPRGLPGRVRHRRRRLRLRQEHPAQPGRQARETDIRDHRGGRPGRVHVPGGDLAAVADGAQQHRACAATSRGATGRSSRTGRGTPRAGSSRLLSPTSDLTSCRAACGSASRSHALWPKKHQWS